MVDTTYTMYVGKHEPETSHVCKQNRKIRKSSMYGTVVNPSTTQKLKLHFKINTYSLLAIQLLQNK